MNFSIEGIDDVVDKLTQYASGDKIQRGLAMAGEVVRAHAVANCPVATGRLKGSIVSQVDGDSVAIGPTADYGIYVEFGTGSKATNLFRIRQKGTGRITVAVDFTQRRVKHQSRSSSLH